MVTFAASRRTSNSSCRLAKKKITCTQGQVRLSLGDDKGRWTKFFAATIYFSDEAIAELGSPGLWTGSIGEDDIKLKATVFTCRAALS